MARRIDTEAVIAAVRLSVGAKPSAPAAGYDLIYAKTGGLYLETEAGTEIGPFMANPMTAAGDVIIGGTSGAATRLAKGTDGQVLKLASGAPTWAADAGMTNPMTTAGDIILGGASGAAGRLAIGASSHVLTSNGTTAAWAAPASSDIGCRVYQTATNTVTTAWVTLTFGAENFDTDTMHSNDTNPERITITTAGKYIIGGSMSIAQNSVVGLRVRVDGTTVLASHKQGNGGSVESVSVTTLYDLTAGQYLELQGYSSAEFASSGDGNTSFWAKKI
jgi:hypothetical protein